MLLLNARSLKKPNAVFHLQTDFSPLAPDICCVTETWLNASTCDSLVRIANYNLIRRDQTNSDSLKRSGGGVCAYLANFYEYQKIEPPGNEHCEILWLSIKIGNSTILLIVVYFPPDALFRDAYQSHIVQNIDEVFVTCGCDVAIICGDFNQLDTDFITSDLGYIQLSTEATRGQNTLDKVFNSTHYFDRSDTVKITLSSDHFGVFCETAGVSDGKRVVYFRDQREENKRMFTELLVKADLSSIFSADDVDDAVELFQQTLSSIYDHACPLRRIVIRPSDPVYVTPVLKVLLKKKNKLHRQKRFKDADRRSQQIRRIIVDNARSCHTKGSIGWWKQVNSYLQKDTVTICNQFYASQLNEYYNSISYRDNVEQTTNVSVYGDLPELTVLHMYEALRSVRKTAAGPDGLPYWIYQRDAAFLADVVTYIFNKCIANSQFPSSWKISRISPIPKTSRPREPKDLRPVSVTCIIARVFERLLHKHFIAAQYNVGLRKTQFGFRKHGSCASAVIKILNDTHSFLETDEYVRIITHLLRALMASAHLRPL